MNDPAWPRATADLCDLLGDQARIIELPWRHFGRRAAFAGRAVTIRVADDTSRVRPILEEAGNCRVLVIDNGGSSARAVFGDRFAALMRDNGWEGCVVNGAIRDTAKVDALPVGLVALAVTPRRPIKQQLGERDAVVVLDGTHVRTGDWITVDADGVVVVPAASQQAAAKT